MIEIKDLYWAAGIIEGEGTFTLQYGRKNPRIRIAVGMTDRDIIYRLYNIFKLGWVSNPYYEEGKRPRWTWAVQGQQDVASILMTIYPIMGERRQERIKELLIEWIKNPNTKKGNTKLSDEQVREIRKLYKLGKSSVEIASMYGVASNTIMYAINVRKIGRKGVA